MKERIDILLLKRGLETSRKKAISLIMSGKVIVDENRIDKPGKMISKNANIRLKNKKTPFVSRGALKLKKAIEKWPVNIENTICLDVGASTGGFTEILLNKGAKKIFAVDVGYGQLAWKLRNDKRVINLERTNILHIKIDKIKPIPSIAVIDVSFISITNVLPKIINYLTSEAYIYTLIKPQFEVEKINISKGGIVRNDYIREKIIKKIINYTKNLGLKNIGISKSPITGTKGNIEYIAAFKT